MPSTKEFDVKLHSLRNTEKMTRTMKLVAMSKLYRAQEAQRNAKLYAQRLKDLIHRLAASVESAVHPLLASRDEVKNILVLVFTSDKGLCGSFNNSLNKQVSTWLEENQSRYQKIDLSFCGKRGYVFFKKMVTVKQYYENVTGKSDFLTATRIGEDLCRDFLSDEYDEVYVAHNEYHSPLSQKAIFDKILPIEPKELMEGGEKISADYIFEPQKEELLKFLIPKYLYFRIYFTFLENAAGEHGARMTAMDNATKNAGELIDRYTLLRNRARQAAITTELIEIVSGAEALN